MIPENENVIPENIHPPHGRNRGISKRRGFRVLEFKEYGGANDLDFRRCMEKIVQSMIIMGSPLSPRHVNILPLDVKFAYTRL